MSSFDRGRGEFRRAGWLASLLVAGALALSACTPVYGPGPDGAATGGGALSGVAIAPVDDRVAQVVRSRLIFGMSGGSEPANPSYHMRLSVGVTELPLGIGGTGTSPTFSVTVAVTYEVTKFGAKDVVLKGTSRGSASYDRVNSAFANMRAKIDAENRAAASVADDVRIRVAAGLVPRV